MTFRKALFWLHLMAGVTAGAIVLLMSFTGVLLTYERQMIAWMDRGPYQVTPGATRMSVQELAMAALKERALPQNAVFTLRSGDREAAEIVLSPAATLFVNPYNGAVVGVGEGRGRALFQKIRAWHRWVGMDGPGREAGKGATGAANLAFLLILASGAYLWLPRVWSWRHLRPVLWFRGGLSGKARDFNWHNAIGVWCLLPLLFIVLTAIPISYTWGGKLVYALAGDRAPQAAGGAAKGQAKAKPLEPADLEGLDAMWEIAKRQEPGWRSISAPLAEANAKSIVFTIDQGDGGQPQKRGTLEFNRQTGEVTMWRPFSAGSAGQRLRSWSRFTHTGEAFGLAGQTVAGIASAGAVVLVWTGVALALRRWSAWRVRRQ